MEENEVIDEIVENVENESGSTETIVVETAEQGSTESTVQESESIVQMDEVGEPNMHADASILEAKEKIMLECEDKSRRNAFVKHFKTSKGTYQARQYGVPVHYWNESEKCFREIDNEFVEHAAQDASDPFDVDGYENKYGAVKVKMARNLNVGKTAVLTSGEYSLMMGLHGRKRRNKRGVEKSIGEATVLNYARSYDKFVRKLDERIHTGGNSGEVRYNDFVSGADLQFILDGAKLKENIIIKEKAESYEYEFSLKVKNLKAKLSKDGKSVLCFSELDNEDKNPIFTMPAPYMFDANGAHSGAVEYELNKNSRDGYKLKIKPDTAWIESRGRQFPITIDPTIVYNKSEGLRSVPKGSERITYVHSPDITSIDSYNYNHVGGKYCILVEATGYVYEKAEVYFNIYPGKMLRDVKILGATYYTGIAGVSCSSSSTKPNILIRKVKDNDNSDVIGGVQETLVTADIIAAGAGKLLEVDLTKFYGDSDFEGFQFRLQSVSGISKLRISLTKPEDSNPDAAAFIAVDYTDYKYESARGDRCITHSLNRAGIGAVDLFTKDFKFIHPDFTLESPGIPMEVSHIYNSAYRINQAPYAYTYCGSCWRTNYHQYIGVKNLVDHNGVPIYYYIDSMGDESVITSQKGRYAFEKDGTTTLNFLADGKYLVEDKYGNRMRFYANGWLEEMFDAQNNCVKVIHNVSVPGQITELRDNFGRRVNFGYTGGFLSNITHTAAAAHSATGSIKYNLSFNYSGSELRKISYGTVSAGTADETEFLYETGRIGLLREITDPTNRRLNYFYDSNGSLYQIWDSSGNTVGYNMSTSISPMSIREWDLAFGNRYAKVTHKGVTTVFGFDAYGKTKFSYDEIYVPEWDGLNKTKVGDHLNITGVNITGATAIVVSTTLNQTMDNFAEPKYDMYNTGSWHGDPVGTSTDYAVYGSETSTKSLKVMNGHRPYRDYYVTSGTKKYVVSCFAKASQNTQRFSLQAELLNSTGNVVTQGEWHYDDTYEAWQPGAVCFTGSGTKIRVYLNCAGGKAAEQFFGDLRICEAPFQTQEEDLVVNSDGSWTKVFLDNQKRVEGQINYDEYGRRFEYQYHYGNGRYAHRIQKVKDILSYRDGGREGMVKEYEYDPDFGIMTKLKRYTSTLPEYCVEDVYNVSKRTVLGSVELVEKPNPVVEICTDLRTGKVKKTVVNDGVTAFTYEQEGDLKKIELESSHPQLSADKLQNQYYYTKFLLTGVRSDNSVIQYKYNGFNELISILLNGKTVKWYDYDEIYNYSEQEILAGSGPNGKYKQRVYYNKSGLPTKKTERINGGSETELLRAEYDGKERLETITDFCSAQKQILHYGSSGGAMNKITYATLSGAQIGSIEWEKNNSNMKKEVRIGHDMVRYYCYYTPEQAPEQVPEGEISGLTVEPAKGSSVAYSYRYDFLNRPADRYAELGIGGKKFRDTYEYALESGKPTDRVNKMRYRFDNKSLGQTEYTYYADGSIQSEKNICNNNQQYTYDQANRLIREDNQSFNFTKVYQYGDGTTGGGNIKKVTKYSYRPTVATENLTNGTETAYTYDVEDRIVNGNTPVRYLTDRLINFGTEQISDYDLAGNPCNYRGNALQWERGRRLNSFGKISFTYDAGGIRQSKTLPGGVSHKYFTEGSAIHKESRSDGTQVDDLWYYYDQSGLCNIESSSNQSISVYQYHVKKNLMGDIVMLVDNNGNVVAKYKYDAWGNHKIYTKNANGAEISIYDSFTGKITVGYETHIGNLNPFRYRGYYYDAEIGFYYLQTRYYDPQVGRFINADAVDYADPQILNGINLYAYCLNNPIMYLDPTGHFPWFILILAIGFGAAAGGIAAYNEDPKDLWKGVLIGGLKGAVVGLSFGFGIGLGTGALSLKAGLIAFGATTIGAFGAGMGIYYLETKFFEDREFDSGEMWKEGAYMSVRAAVNFWLGAGMGKLGLFPPRHRPNFSNGIFDGLVNYALDTLTREFLQRTVIKALIGFLLWLIKVKIEEDL